LRRKGREVVDIVDFINEKYFSGLVGRALAWDLGKENSF
jgi:hypothetical protein